MLFPAKLLCLLAFVSILSNFAKTISGLVQVPNITPYLRDLALIVLMFYTLSKSDLIKQPKFLRAVIFCFLILVVNLMVALFDDRVLAGLYYLRSYATPLIFLVAIYCSVKSLDYAGVIDVARFIAYGWFFVFFAAISIYFIGLEFSPNLLRSLMGGEEIRDLASAWTIAGGTWFRMGLPAKDPNTLGLVAGLFILFSLIVFFSGAKEVVSRRVLFFGVISAALVTIASFSRSSWVSIIVGLAVLYPVFKGQVASLIRDNLGGIFLVLVIFLLIAISGFILLDIYSNGMVSRWFELNISGIDPSARGHSQSIVDAINNLEIYYLHGYPRGAVGPIAALFGGGMHNVENSILGIFMDMGLPAGVLYLASLLAILASSWIYKAQWPILCFFVTALQFLPYIFQPDVIVFFLMLLVVSGQLAKMAYQNQGLDKASYKFNQFQVFSR
jgi:hypothetical protein